MEYKTNSANIENDEKMIKKVREMAEIMKEMGLTVLEWTKMDQIRMERPPEGAVFTTAPAAGAATAAAPEQPAAQGTAVKSPMVGTFYESPSPDKPAFVSVGDKVSVGDVLCVIEAMKMMNEIMAEHDGVITEVCVDNKQLVEFGQILFRIDTN